MIQAKENLGHDHKIELNCPIKILLRTFHQDFLLMTYIIVLFMEKFQCLKLFEGWVMGL